MIDDINFEIEGSSMPTFFINCHNESVTTSRQDLYIPTLFFINDEVYFHGETGLDYGEDEQFL